MVKSAILKQKPFPVEYGQVLITVKGISYRAILLFHRNNTMC